MAATRRGLIRGAIVALFAPAGARAGATWGASTPRVDSGEWASLSEQWLALREWEDRLVKLRMRLESMAVRVANDAHDLVARERILDLKERFGSAFVSTIEWPAVDEWGAALRRETPCPEKP